jgi:hypothetical protein
MQGYDFPGADLATLILRRFYPERTDRESTIIRDWLLAHGAEYDRFSFSVRVGEGQTPNPDDLPGVQRSVAFSSRKRIDVLAWRGAQPTIVEVKERVTPQVLGQLVAYRDLFLEEKPDAEEPILVAIGRYSDPDTLRVLTANGITVYLYEPAAGD